MAMIQQAESPQVGDTALGSQNMALEVTTHIGSRFLFYTYISNTSAMTQSGSVVDIQPRELSDILAARFVFYLQMFIPRCGYRSVTFGWAAKVVAYLFSLENWEVVQPLYNCKSYPALISRYSSPKAGDFLMAAHIRMNKNKNRRFSKYFSGPVCVLYVPYRMSIGLP